MRIAVLSIGNEPEKNDGSYEFLNLLMRELGQGADHPLDPSDDLQALRKAWRRFDVVFLVDAAQSGLPSGTLRVLDPVPTQPGGGVSSTCRIAGEMGLFRMLEQLPRRMVLYGKEGDNHRYGCAVSPKGDVGGSEAAELIRENLSSSGTQKPGR